MNLQYERRILMNEFLSENILYLWDFIKLRSSEILTLYGNFKGELCRARLSFYPNANGDRLINGKTYKKVTYETNYQIPACRKLLNLPGEQHFIVHRSQITKIYQARNAFDGLSRPLFNKCMSFIDILNRACSLDAKRHGLTGGRALGHAIPTSDFDWVIYDDQNITDIKTCITSDRRFSQELTFTMAHVYRKYSEFSGLNKESLDALFKNRWKYFRFNDLPISLNFVDPTLLADDFLEPSRLGKRVKIEATVSDYIGCYYSLRIIELDVSGEKYKVLTWLFLYNGVFENGNVVEAAGRTCTINNESYILVESRQDYIRKITAERLK